MTYQYFFMSTQYSLFGQLMDNDRDVVKLLRNNLVCLALFLVYHLYKATTEMLIVSNTIVNIKKI